MDIVISRGRNGIAVDGFGACSPTPCQWGNIPGTLFGTSVSSATGNSFEANWRFADRTAALALSASTAPRRVLDIGCGTGYLLRLLAWQWPQASELAGIDPAPSMIEGAAGSARDERLRFCISAAERLPYPDSSFDIVVSTTSFDHWSDQQAGLRECAC